MIDAGLAAARLTAVLRAAMRHGNKIRPSAIAPGHRGIPDFSLSFQAVYSFDRRLPSTTVCGEDWPQLQMNLADVAIGGVSNRQRLPGRRQESLS
jgi:hypothetical protein